MRQVSPGLKKWEEEGGKSDGRDSSQHWKGLCVARGMAYLLAHIKASLKARRETSIQTTTVMRNLLLMIPQAVIDLSGSLKSLPHFGSDSHCGIKH